MSSWREALALRRLWRAAARPVGCDGSSPRRPASRRRRLDEDANEIGIVRRRLDRRPPAGTDHAVVSKPMFSGGHGGDRGFARRSRSSQGRRPGGGLAWGLWGKRCAGRKIRGRPKRRDSPLLNAVGVSGRRERRRSVRRKTPTRKRKTAKMSGENGGRSPRRARLPKCPDRTSNPPGFRRSRTRSRRCCALLGRTPCRSAGSARRDAGTCPRSRAPASAPAPCLPASHPRP